MTEEFDDIELLEDDGEGQQELYEHFRIAVDRGQVPVRMS